MVSKHKAFDLQLTTDWYPAPTIAQPSPHLHRVLDHRERCRVEPDSKNFCQVTAPVSCL